MYDNQMLMGELLRINLVLYTDAFVIRGTIRTRQPRITDILNAADEPFIVISDATTDEYGSSGVITKTEYAQVNLGPVLFAVADAPSEPRPDLRAPKGPAMT